MTNKTPTREYLLGFIEGWYSSFMSSSYLEKRMKLVNKRSKASLLKLYLSVKEQI